MQTQAKKEEEREKSGTLHLTLKMLSHLDISSTLCKVHTRKASINPISTLTGFGSLGIYDAAQHVQHRYIRQGFLCCYFAGQHTFSITTF